MKQLLSAYYDAELPADQQTAIEEHLPHCADCSGELQGFHQLSALADGLTEPEPSPQIWHHLERELDQQTEGRPVASVPGDRSFWPRLSRVFHVPHPGWALTAAAVLFIAVGWFSRTTWLAQHGDHQMSAKLGPYLETFGRDPDTAQMLLLASFDGQAVAPQHALGQLGYRPVAADGLPQGYVAESTYVMRMPCCTCAQTLCRRADGTALAIFEHDDDHADWFGSREGTLAVCSGKQCCLIDLDDRLAASWKRGTRHITLIGARDVAEVDELVAWFDQPKETRL